MYDVNITPQTLLQNSTYLLPRCVATASALGCVCTASIVFGGKLGGGDILLYYIYIIPFSTFCPAPFLFCYAFAQISFVCSVCGRVVLFYL